MSGQVLGTPVIDQFYMSGKASIIGMGGAKIGHDCRYGGGGGVSLTILHVHV